ncbi:hypothetical protein GYMLUDRAFT_54458 [Collybiopsis luxurians FD-317 M1]|nr:hypothetical protein GYMLUDRAFT_54458 [Collybiopsis luxurians FD-317 M1]
MEWFKLLDNIDPEGAIESMNMEDSTFIHRAENAVNFGEEKNGGEGEKSWNPYQARSASKIETESSDAAGQNTYPVTELDKGASLRQSEEKNVSAIEEEISL